VETNFGPDMINKLMGYCINLISLFILVNSYIDQTMENHMKPEPEKSSKTPFSREETQTTSPIGHKHSSDLEHMEAELRLTLEEIAQLQNSLAEANMKNVVLQSSLDAQNKNIERDQILKPILQELKQPIHTIQGYLDLLSNESVGILGTFQKRFVERISSSIDHMDQLLKSFETDNGDTNDDEGKYAKEFSLTSVIEETLALYTELIRTKSITLKVEFENNAIVFLGDQELFERVLNILFTNSCTSVETEGTITLGLKILRGKKPAQVLISVQSCDHDSPKAKPLPVNLDEFKDLDIKLEGFGSILKDLVKAKTLTEEMHGKMEIFSVPFCGSLIRIKLPVTP
jgi:signal transduction histidine kinase